jgi:urease accessory protein
MTVHSYFKFSQLWARRLAALLSLLVVLLGMASPALAHHAMAGNTPRNFLEGLVSGLAHPVIGVDHFAFVVASGLLAALLPRGWQIPIAFVVASLVGTGLHLLSVSLPMPEVLISASVLIMGGVLALQHQRHSWLLTGFAALAGIFHGYAYGESIVGAEMPSLVAYLIGFTAIQLIIATAAYQMARSMRRSSSAASATSAISATSGSPLKLRFAGFIIFGAGIALLSSALL